MKKLKLLFNNSLIRNKIIIIYIPLIIIPLMVLAMITNYIFTQEIVKKTFINVLDDSSLIVTRINSLISNAESCANIIVKDINSDSIKPLFSANAQDEALNFVKNRKILYVLNYALVVFPDVESVIFIDNKNEIYSTHKNLYDNYEKAEKSDIVKAVNSSNGKNLWFPMQCRDFLVQDKNAVVLTLGKKVLDIDGGNMIGTLVININETSISSIYDKLGTAKGGNYSITDEEGIVISSKDKNELFKNKNEELTDILSKSGQGIQKTIKIDGQEMLITARTIDKMKWRLVNKTDVLQLTSETRKLSVIIFLIGLICLLIAILGGGILSNVIAKPIVTLTKKMQKIKEGSLDIQYDVNSADEIGLLASGFNSMIERIRGLLDKVESEQKKKREYEFALIQAQIKPHFLYNSLDLIYIFCSMGRNEEAQNTTKSLADFYRIALSNGQEIISIEEELNNVKNYLSIQKIRYSDIFEYEFIIDKNSLEYDIPKLTIQPLVENSIYHGLKVKGSFGKLLVESSVEDENIVIQITDDGVGISKSKLERIFEVGDEVKSSFGLTSVNERIKIYYGEAYGLTIKSEEYKWTKAVIRIPKRKAGMETNV